ncbi:MAG: adenylate/guanylate cyclase domain-containing protein [Vampirovibrionia bacterium]
MKKDLKLFIIVIVIWCLIYFIPAIRVQFNPDNFFLGLIYQSKYKLFPPKEVNKDIVIVDMDNDSLWIKERPDYMAELIKLIAKEGKAEVIGVDILYDDYKNPDPDKNKDVIKQANCPYKIDTDPMEVKLACNLLDEAVSNVVLATTIKKVKGKDKFLRPLEFLKNAAWATGHILIPMDKAEDSFYKASAYYTDGNNHEYSFPIIITSYIKGDPSIKNNILTLGKTKINLLFSTDISLYYIPELLAPSKAFKYVTIKDLLKNKDNIPYLEKTFKQKVVLIGSTSEILEDLKNTPFTKYNKNLAFDGRMPGVEFHANCINSLLNDKLITFAPDWLNGIYAICFIFLAMIVIIKFKSTYTFILNISVALLAFIVSLFAFANYSILLSTGTVITAILIMIPAGYIYKYLTIDRFFGRYVSPDVSELIWQNREQLLLKGEKKFATVMFTDIRGFTSLSEKADPAEILDILNQYFDRMSDVIYKTGGNLNKFIGDGLMILYGVPFGEENPAMDAKNSIKAAIMMLQEVEELNKKWQNEGKNIQIAIGAGIHSGEVIAGNIGCANRLEYSVIGDTVNLSSRLEGTNKEFKTNIIISESTYQLVKDTYNMKYLDSVNVKGRDQAVKIYTIDDNSENKQ